MNRPNDSIELARTMAKDKDCDYFVFKLPGSFAWKLTPTRDRVAEGCDFWTVNPDGTATPSDGRDPREQAPE